MNFYEPFQRLSFVYFAKDSSVYVKSSMSVYLPEGVSLIGKDTLFNTSYEAILKYYLTINNLIKEPYIFEQERSIKFLDSKELAMINDSTVLADTTELKAMLSSLIERKLESSRFCLVTCEIYNEQGNKTGQSTNTIAKDGEVIIL